MRGARERTTIRRALRYLTSFEIFIALAICALVWSALAIYLMERPPIDVLGLVPFKVFMALILINRLSGFISEIRRRSWIAVMSAGIIVAVVGVALCYVSGFRGVVGLGEGEPMTGYMWSLHGPMADIPELALTVEKVDAPAIDIGDDTEVTVGIGDGQEITLSRGETERIGSGTLIRLVDVEAAPIFGIKKNSGEILMQGAVKLKLYPKGEQDYFLTQELPHRFYLTLTGNAEKPLRLKILRAKLVLFDKNVSMGEEVLFDDLTMVFPDLGKWAVLEVRRYPSLWLIFMGLGVAALGGMVTIALEKGKR